ncbi:MAG: NAD(P)H-dependent oxidoreductase subunit E [Bacteroidales bacterium]|nr:NAD(P)H-dependent oxidoreductase subunit E [Bacteroidales bacterium]
MIVNINDIDQIIDLKGRGKTAVIPLLQAIQARYNFLPEEALKRVCDTTDITASEIIGVASFYHQFRFEPAGKHVIRVCVGTACHVKGSLLVYDSFRRELKLGKERHTDEAGDFTLEKVSCLGCCTLAPVVQIDRVTYGHVSSDKVDQVVHDFQRRGRKSQKKAVVRMNGDKTDGEIRIGLGSCCVASGSEEVRKAIEETVSLHHLNVKIKHVGCVGMCHQVPLMEVVPVNKDASLYAKVKPEDVKSIIHRHFKPDNLLQRIRLKLFDSLESVQSDTNWSGIERYSLDMREKHVSQFLGNQIPIATEYRGVINPLDIEEYISKRGFLGLKKALKLTPSQVIEEIKESGIRGRGGAGFPTGDKWETVARQEVHPKYLICNGDEGDPGAFMDRMLLESYPYRIIEGMLIAAYATGADSGYFYIRAEYPLAVTRMREAIRMSEEHGFLGKNILNTGFSFEVNIYEGAGAFVCGEETALIASIEGKRGFPRLRPPYPAQKGLWDKPTLVNNAETYAQVAYIIREGSRKFSSIGTENSRGTKVFALAGKINRGGLIEVPMGITIRKVVEDIGGGIAEGRKFKAVQIGGPSGGCIPHWLADTPIDFHSLHELGAMMGSGGMVVLDETDCMVDMARYFLSFTQNESCGKCTFCRIGTRKMLDILDRLCTGKTGANDLEELEKLAEWTKKGSLCGLGRTAPNPVLSTLAYFREEYEAHARGVCPATRCRDLITYSVNDNCIGCTLCSQRCPADAIAFTPHVKHEIQTDKCIRCNTCRQVCPADAITVK